MDKNSFPEAKQIWKGNIALFLILAIIAGMSGARFVASLATIFFGVNALWNIHPRCWLRERWCLFGLAWVLMYALSYFWSTDTKEWFAHLQVKFPFLFLPLAFTFLPPFNARQLRAFTWGLVSLMCAGTLFSISFLWRTPGELIAGYKYAHVLTTPFYNDHIAFSSTVALTIAWVAFIWPCFSQKWQRIVLGLLAFCLAVYLHVLAAKTGLVCLYLLLAVLIAYQTRRSFKRGMLLLVITGIGLITAFQLLPTLRERIGYSMVTWRSYMMGERHGIYSDAGRIISFDLACKSIADHPIIGVGAGDVMHEMKNGYARWYPQVAETLQIWPHNQFLTSAMAAGIPTTLLFIIWLFAPLKSVKTNRSGLYFIAVWLMLLVPLMADLF